MTSEQLIKDLLKRGESEQLEFKESVRNTDIGKIICGFLNQKGGQLLIGIADDKTIIGVKGAEKFRSKIEQYLFQELIPEAPVTVSVENYNDKQLLLIKVWEGTKQPYIFDGSIYYRLGAHTIKASSKEISELIHKRQANDIHWERRTALGVELEDLDIPEIKKTIVYMAHNKTEIQVEPLDFLANFGLYRDGNFTNAAVILFAKNPTRFIPQARGRMTFLKDEKTGEAFYDDKVLEGNIFQNIEAIQKFLENNLSLTRKFDETQWQRTDEYTYPMNALREGVLNALVHREYGLTSSSLSIIIFSDRLEITNSGKSPYTQSELKKNHLSMPYNPDIAHLVFLRGYIEKIGRGTLKIMEACKQAGLKTPVWDIGEQTVKLTFFNDTNFSHRIKELADTGKIRRINDRAIVDIDTVSDTVNDAVSDAVKKEFIDAVSVAVSDALSETVKTIKKNKTGASIKQIMDGTGKSNAQVKRYLQILKKLDLIEFKGPAKTGKYSLTEQLTKKLNS